MNVIITKPVHGGTIAAISSKSLAHRFLICSALSDNASQVVCSETSEDIDATVRCLNALGAQITYENAIFNVSPIKPPVTGARLLDCGESGSLLRFILPVACALGVEAAIHMSGRLPSRPLSPLYEELISHGCALSPQGSNPLHTSGQLHSGKYTIPGNISSQYFTGLMFALPLLPGASHISVLGDIESKPYIDITLAVLKKYGVVIRSGRQSYLIEGGQRYTAPSSVIVEGDWSNAAFWLCAGAIGNVPVTMTNLDASSLQGDKYVLAILKRFGAHIQSGPGWISVTPAQLNGIEIDAGDTPDLIPVLSVVAAVSKGKTTIRNAARLRIKESDRLNTVTQTLRALGADITETDDGLIINGKKTLTGGTVHAHGDHRIAMAAAVAASVCVGPVTIENAEAVNKSYPGFFKDYAALGGTFEAAD